jgi:hypothetical protein
MKTLTLALSTLCLVGACASRHTILTVPAVSMSRPSMDADHVVHPGERVNAEYCRGDEPITSKDNNVGLIDEAVAKAQNQSGAEYLSDVTISQKGSCVMVEGVVMK